MQDRLPTHVIPLSNIQVIAHVLKWQHTCSGLNFRVVEDMVALQLYRSAAVALHHLDTAACGPALQVKHFGSDNSCPKLLQNAVSVCKITMYTAVRLPLIDCCINQWSYSREGYSIV
jgi:hypothetical protein